MTPVYKGLKDMLCRGAGLKVIGDYIAEAPEEQFGKSGASLRYDRQNREF
ncbi:MAG: hypothetical protein KatS3mg087_1506 [Patescibacteria group bacterium]|nr:MAG: hypothetical protein KatS3mg087_1506 [Patescibacteria group bacterium]